MDQKITNVNSFILVGRLTHADIRTGTSSKTGHGYVSVTATITGDNNHEYEVKFFSNDVTSKGQPSKLYKDYCDMKSLEGQKVEITGSFRENRYFSTRSNQMASIQELSGRFIDVKPDSTPDKATWEISGFIVSELVEKQNKAGETYRYDLRVGQANSQNKANIFTLHVDPSAKDILNGIRAYGVGDTVHLYGRLDFTVVETVVEHNTTGGFGSVPPKTYTNRQRNFFITGGDPVITDETAYDGTFIRELIEDYKANDTELAARGVQNAKAAPAAAESTPKVRTRQASLI